MKGNIYCQQKCPVCQGKMTHDERRGNCFCKACNIPASGKYVVKFGREITKRFKTYQEAVQFLYGLRYKTVENTFDVRDYKKDNPLGFETQVQQWLKVKKEQVKPSSWRNLNNYMNKAISAWGQTNVKALRYADFEDFLFDKNKFASEKTRSNARSCLHDFFTWLKRREGINIPDLPDCKFQLGRRTVTTWEIQNQVIEQVRKNSDNINPKISFAIEILATYINLRPDDLRRVKEEDFNLDSGWLIIHNPTKRQNAFKSVRLTAEHCKHWNKLSRAFPGLPHLPFFRHEKASGGDKHAGKVFGQGLLYTHWKKACKQLGIKNLDLYGGTRHTTATELARVAGHDNTRKATGHLSNKAFDRYCQAQDETAFDMAQVVSDGRASVISINKKKKSK